MKKILLALVLAGLGSAAQAGPVLWQNIEAGMTQDEVRALLSDRKVSHGKNWSSFTGAQVGECKGAASIRFVEGKVKFVRIMGTGCAKRLFTALIGKYGEPASADTEKHVLGGNDSKVSIWRAEGKTIRYKGSDSIVGDWEIEYRPIDDASL